jgi:hypothetical protein
MRTTLDLDNDVLLSAKEIARRERKTAGQVISELVRRALVQSPVPWQAAEPPAAYGFRPFAPRGGVVSNDLVKKLRDEGEY